MTRYYITTLRCRRSHFARWTLAITGESVVGVRHLVSMKATCITSDHSCLATSTELRRPVCRYDRLSSGHIRQGSIYHVRETSYPSHGLQLEGHDTSKRNGLMLSIASRLVSGICKASETFYVHDLSNAVNAPTRPF